MSKAQTEEKNAVAAGYWNNFRFDPRLADEGKNPFQLDSKAPTASYRDFIMNEVRYNALSRAFPAVSYTHLGKFFIFHKERFPNCSIFVAQRIRGQIKYYFSIFYSILGICCVFLHISHEKEKAFSISVHFDLSLIHI